MKIKENIVLNNSNNVSFIRKTNEIKNILNNSKKNESSSEKIIDIKNKNILDQNNKEKNNEFFSNSPVIYLFIKIFLLFEGHITRILLQLGDLYISAIITNIYLEIIIIQVCASAEYNTFIKIYAFISATIFSFLMKIIVTIAYWELYQLKWFDLNPFDSITTLLNLKLEKYMIRNIYIIFNIILGILFWLFIIGLLTMSLNNSKFIDIINLIIFIIIPLLKFVIFYLAYIYIYIRTLFKEKYDGNDENPFQYWINLSNIIDKGTIKIGNSSQEIKKSLYCAVFFI